jgi:hypothetical protein
MYSLSFIVIIRFIYIRIRNVLLFKFGSRSIRCYNKCKNPYSIKSTTASRTDCFPANSKHRSDHHKECERMLAFSERNKETRFQDRTKPKSPAKSFPARDRANDEQKSVSAAREHQMEHQMETVEIGPGLRPTKAEQEILSCKRIRPMIEKLLDSVEPFDFVIVWFVRAMRFESGYSNAVMSRVIVGFMITYPNYLIAITCAVFVRASLRERKTMRGSWDSGSGSGSGGDRDGEHRNREFDAKNASRKASYLGAVALEAVADRMETIASIASGRDPLALRVAVFGSAVMFVGSFFVSFSSWCVLFALFLTKPPAVKHLIESMLR